MDDKIRYEVAKQIYEYGVKVFFGEAPIDVAFRLNQGYKGAARKFLDYIWYHFIEPQMEEKDESY